MHFAAGEIIAINGARKVSNEGHGGFAALTSTGDLAMKVSLVLLQPNLVRSGLTVALAIGTLAALSARADAAELDPITLSAPIVKKERQETATEIPTEDITVNARIAVDMETLRNDSGVVLLKDRVEEAAYKACYAADPIEADDGTCVRDAIKAARPQVDAAIARARAMS